MQRLIILSFLLLSASLLAAQTAFSLKKINALQLPANIKFRGKLYEGWKWTDKLGENILVTSLVATYKDKLPDPETEEETYSAELYAFHFIKKDSVYQLLWKISDAVKGCFFDLSVEFIKGAIRITDLDKDGIAETTVQYKLACRSDVSPAQMKLILHEDSVKYALRGTMWVKASEKDVFTVTEQNVNLETLKEYKGGDDDWEKLYGRYQSENDFKTAPSAFLIFVRRQWLRYAKESFE